MKSKAFVVFSTLVIALTLMAQSTPSNAPAAPANQAQACGCCNHQSADGKMACCGNDGSCCAQHGDCCQGGDCCKGKDGKTCSMASKDSSGKMSCCARGKCSMMSEKSGGKCCGGNMCQRPKATA